jgi:NAD(P) transhydrogenase subunit beta
MSLGVLEPGGDVATALYIVSFSMFIFGVRRGTHPSTAKQGNLIAAAGMAIAVATTLLLDGIGNWGLIVAGIAVGTAVGVVASLRVQMTAMPQMVALYNGVGGGAVALIAWSEFRHGLSEIDDGLLAEIPLDTFVPVMFSMVIGSISFWGSNIAFGKLQGVLPGQPIKAPGQQLINGLLLVGVLAACIVLGASNDDPSQGLFIAVLVAAALLGNLVVLPIGGADMPVVISLLNAFTGLAAAGAGFALDNVALIVAGTLVGSSGTILTMEMATAMNRSVANILFAGFGALPAGAGAATEERPHTSIGPQDAAIKLAYADSVVIVPGYGMAVAQAQHSVKEMADQLEQRGVNVSYAIHPVAGRMPGHMNVLLAEADVPYEKLRRHRQRPLLPRQHLDAVLRRQAGRRRHRRRGRRAVAACLSRAGGNGVAPSRSRTPGRR